MQIRLGTRASALARWQAEWVAARLVEAGVDVLLVPITTSGDQQQRASIAAVGSQGVFTKELQAALLDERIDLAVHSLKDLPTDPVEGLCLAAVPQRGPVGDVLVCPRVGSLADLPKRSIVGTGSLRRRAQLLYIRNDLQVRDIRGNVETRLAKLAGGDYDALLLAEAGLRRLELDQHIAQLIPKSIMLPAVGQGALGLETRLGDEQTRSALTAIDHAATHAAVLAERTMLATLEGGCLAPVAAWGRVEKSRLTLTGRVLAANGSRRIQTTLVADQADAQRIGNQVAQRLLVRGAARFIQSSRQAT